MKPSELKECQITFNKFIPFGNFFAMMWKGKILIKNIDKGIWEKVKNTLIGKKIVNHENIHLKQAVSTNDSWLCYYITYVLQYLKNLPIIYGFEFPYYFSSFELEAFENENNLTYLNDKDKCQRWKLYNALSLSQKRTYWKIYKDLTKNKNITFSEFVKTYIAINIF